MTMAWWREATPEARRALVAAALGWMLDSFDVMLYALVLTSLMADLGLDPSTAGLLGSATLVASAAGGFLFGVIADRHGRTRALIASVLIYSVFTFACGLAQSVWQLALFRLLLGLGMGGEWASGAALVSETWRAEHRGTALGFMQSAWAVGYAAAATVNGLVLPRWGWRAVFFVGILPALLTLWIRRRVDEPEIWKAARAARGPAKAGHYDHGAARGPAGHDDHTAVGALGGDAAGGALRYIFSRDLRGLTIAVTVMNACTMFAWWGFNLWLPGYLSMSRAQGGVGLSAGTMSAFVVAMQVGMWFGYVTFGFISDAIGRRRTYVIYLLTAAALILIYVSVRAPLALLLLGPFVAFFATGYFSGFGAVTAEIYPTVVRATAQGFTYNVGRVASAVAPYAVGTLAQTRGFAAALSLASLAFVLAAFTWIFIPETKGRALA